MKTVIIKTYLFESGLFYLAKTLEKELLLQGFKVFFIPKEKYVKVNGIFKRTYPKHSVETSENSFIFTTDRSIESQTLDVIKKVGANVIISFETLMNIPRWLNVVGQKVRLIDVPMVEWVSKNHLNRGSYKLFDEIWCLTQQSEEVFLKANYSNAKRVAWNLADRDIFFAEPRQKNTAKFYHAASLNSHHSTKNTDLVVAAFDKFSRQNYEAELVITGKVPLNKTREIIEKNANIAHLSEGPLTRENVAQLYRSCNCVIAPSTKEGLGLSLYEAKASGALVITTDIAPMNEAISKFLCKPKDIIWGNSLVPQAILEEQEIRRNIELAFNEIKKKWPQEFQ